MAETYKILSKTAPADTAEHVLYSTSAGKEAILTNITVANRSTTNKTFDINVVDELLTDNDLAGQPYSAHYTMYQEKDGFTDSTVIRYSTDEITWSYGTLPFANNWQNFSYINNTYYALIKPMMGASSTATSTDLITWTQNTSLGNISITSSSFVNNKIVITGGYSLDDWSAHNFIYNSTDGSTWNQSAQLPSLTYGQPLAYNVVYGNGVYCARSPYLIEGYYSTDAITWSVWTGSPNSVAAADSGYSNTLAFANGLFVVYGFDYVNSVPVYQSSTNGITWTDVSAPMISDVSNILGNNQTFFVYNNNGDSGSSTDMVTWSYGAAVMQYASASSMSDNTFILYDPSNNGNTYMKSTDGITWTTISNPDPTKTVVNVSKFSASGIAEYSTNPIHSLYKNVTIPANTSKVLEPGVVLGSENSILIKGSSDLTFSAYGVELS